MTDSHNPSVAEGKNSQTVTAERNSNVQIRNAAVAFDNESAAAHKHYTTSLTREEWEVIVTELDHLLLAPYSVVNCGRQQTGSFSWHTSAPTISTTNQWYSIIH